MVVGRAGRLQSKFPIGEVTCLHKEDLPLLHSSLKSTSPLLERAGLFPTYDHLSRYSLAHPKHGLYQILEHFVENAKLSSKYFMSNVEDMMFSQNFSKQGVVRLREILPPDSVKVPKTPTELKDLESIHKVLDLYVWLSLRLEDSFPDREVAASQKSICNFLIEKFLEGNRLNSPTSLRRHLRRVSMPTRS